LGKLRFDGNTMPDYSDLHTQQFYELRYTYGYVFEYKQMFQQFFTEYSPPFSPSKYYQTMLSIGRGNMVDYWALKQIVSRPVGYCGIDPVDWNYRFEQCKEKEDSIKFIQADAVLPLCHMNQLQFDFYVFPKSISEFFMQQVQIMAQAIAQGNQKDTIYFLFFLRNNEKNLEKDMRRIKRLYQILNNQGLYFDDDIKKYYALQYNNISICRAAPSFHNPHTIWTPTVRRNAIWPVPPSGRSHRRSRRRWRSRWPKSGTATR